MTTQFSRRGATAIRWLALGAIGTTLQFAAVHAWAAKSVTLAVASTFTTKRGVARFLVPTSEGTSYRLAYAGGERFAPSVSGVVVN